MAGKVFQNEQLRAQYQVEWSGVAGQQYVHTNMFGESLCVRMESRPLFRYSYNPDLRLIGSSNCRSLKLNTISNNEGKHDLSMPQQPHKRFQQNYIGQRVAGRCACCLTSAPSCCKWVLPRKLDRLGISNRKQQLSKHLKMHMTRADYKSEEYDITGANLDSFVSPEGPSDILMEGMEQIKPWWKQFPKRWVIVLLCFASFLLCNMDRVS